VAVIMPDVYILVDVWCWMLVLVEVFI